MRYLRPAAIEPKKTGDRRRCYEHPRRPHSCRNGLQVRRRPATLARARRAYQQLLTVKEACTHGNTHHPLDRRKAPPGRAHPAAVSRPHLLRRALLRRGRALLHEGAGQGRGHQRHQRRAGQPLPRDPAPPGRIRAPVQVGAVQPPDLQMAAGHAHRAADRHSPRRAVLLPAALCVWRQGDRANLRRCGDRA